MWSLNPVNVLSLYSPVASIEIYFYGLVLSRKYLNLNSRTWSLGLTLVLLLDVVLICSTASQVFLQIHQLTTADNRNVITFVLGA